MSGELVPRTARYTAEPRSTRRSRRWASPDAWLTLRRSSTHAAPGLQRCSARRLHEGGWFGEAHDAEVARAAGEPDAAERARAVGTLVAEQTRLGMFVGVAVGFELARELERRRDTDFDNAAGSTTPIGEPDRGALNNADSLPRPRGLRAHRRRHARCSSTPS